jgi:quaternary ammonium compound-resistance protein SugE
MAWTYLVLAGVFEVGFTTFLKLSAGFTRLAPSLWFLGFALLSFWLLTRAVQTIPLGTAYAVWTGIGAFGTAVVGVAMFGDPMSLSRGIFLATLIASIVGLRLVSPH